MRQYTSGWGDQPQPATAGLFNNLLQKENDMSNQSKKFSFEPAYDLEAYDPQNPKDLEHHFFGLNGTEWFTDVDFQKVFQRFAKRDIPFSVYFVPVHAKTPYSISANNGPQDVEAQYLGTYFPIVKSEAQKERELARLMGQLLPTT